MLSNIRIGTRLLWQAVGMFFWFAVLAALSSLVAVFKVSEMDTGVKRLSSAPHISNKSSDVSYVGKKQAALPASLGDNWEEF